MRSFLYALAAAGAAVAIIIGLGMTVAHRNQKLPVSMSSPTI